MIFSWLVLRAIICCWFIHGLKCGSGSVVDEDIILLLILTVVVMSLLHLLCFANRPFGEVADIYTLGLLLFSIISLPSLCHTLITGENVEVDTIHPFINFKDVYISVWNEIWPLCNYFILVFKVIKLTKFVFCGLYFTIHAVSALLILESIFIYSYNSIFPSIHEMFHFTFDTNITSIYPNGYLHPKWLDPGDFDKPNYKSQIAFENIYEENRKCYMLGEPTNLNDARFPFHYKEIYRYIGEDVSLQCKYNFRGSHHLLVDPVWRLGNKLFSSNNSRREIFNDIKNSSNNDDDIYIGVSSVLNINSLTESDFGEYACIATELNFEIIDNEKVQRKTRIGQAIVFVYDLKRITPKVKLLYKSVGTLLFSQTYFSLYTNDLSENVFSIYSVNDISVDKICPATNTRYCTLFGFFLNIGIYENVLPFTSVRDYELMTGGFKRATAGFCLCSEAFGIHEVTFVRRTALRSKKHLKEEVVHPHTFVVLPLSEISLFRYFDDRHHYVHIEEMIERGENISTIENELNRIRLLIAANEEKVLTMANIVQSAMLIVAVITVVSFQATILELYCTYFVRFPIISFVGKRMILNGIQRVALEGNDYDVFLSYSEEDISFGSETILPFLENECKLRVCDSERNFNPGVAILSYHQKCIQLSERVIIVLSDDYITDPQCASLLLEPIVTLLANYKESKPRDVLVIVKNISGQIPDILEYNARIKLFKWNDDSPVEDNLNVIKNWVYSKNSVHCVIV